MPDGDARAIALGGRNDLEAPALALCPVIGEVLARWADGRLARPHVRLGRDVFCLV